MSRSEIQQALQGCKDENKVLVFCNRKATCDMLSDIYDDAPTYYSDAVNKDAALNRWRSGLMFATGALGAGVDVKSIRWVFHWGLPTGLIEFDQEVGRGGRGGEIVRLVTFLSESMYRQQLKATLSRLEPNQAGLRNVIVGLGCRRKEISLFLGGEGDVHDCEEINGEVCDRCGGIMSDVEKEIRGITDVEQVRTDTT
jgi:superfamily II DNA helicase RecQ